MSLATRCPACSTTFRVVQDQLKVSEGWVRCGQCQEVFNALETLFELPPPSAAEGAAPPAPPRPAAVRLERRVDAPAQPPGFADVDLAETPADGPSFSPPEPEPEPEPLAGEPEAGWPTRTPAAVPLPVAPDDALASDWPQEANPEAAPDLARDDSPLELMREAASPPAVATAREATDPLAAADVHDDDRAPSAGVASSAHLQAAFGNDAPAAHWAAPDGPAPVPAEAESSPDAPPRAAPLPAAAPPATPPTATSPTADAPAPSPEAEAAEAAEPAPISASDSWFGPGASWERKPARRPGARPRQPPAPPSPPDAGAEAEASPKRSRRRKPEFMRQVERAARWQRPAVRAVLGSAAGVLGMLLLAQTGLHFRSDVAARWPVLAPSLAQACQWLGCEVGAPRDIQALLLDHSQLSRTPWPNTLRLNIDLRNTAGHPVQMPALDLSFTDPDGRLLVRKVLQPAELGASAPQRIEADSNWQLEALLDVGPLKVAGFSAEVFYP